jgi:hypothetical protein
VGKERTHDVLNSWGGSPESVPWVDLPRSGSRMRHLGESVELGPWIVQLQFDPDHEVPAHWHKCDTIYIINEGSISFGPDGSGVDRLYRAGDIRWVRAGHFYGPEKAGPEGCVFTLIGAAADLWPSYAPEDAVGAADR